jgi:radical SAM PhpK family P-methyltransferase
MIDCLIVGHNDGNFEEYVEMVRAMGEDAGAWRDLRLAFARIEGRPMHALGAMNRFAGVTPWGTPHHNTDFLWPTILHLGAFLHRHGHTFDYVNRFQFEKKAFAAKLRAGGIRLVAITTTLHVSAHPIIEVIRFVREHNDEAKIVVGGPFISNLPSAATEDEIRQLFEYMDADYYIIEPEGETTLGRLLDALKADGGASRLRAIPNLALRDASGEYRLPSIEPEANGIEENMVDYALFPRAAYGPFVSVRTARSCPFSCAFCGFPRRAGKYRFLDVAHVERELDAIAAIGGVTTLTFLDDTFNVPKKRFHEILEMMIRRRFPFRWNSFFRSDHADERTVGLMAGAGCEGVFLGVESGSDRMLEAMRKTSRRRNYLEVIPRFREAGILTHANLVVGFPGETRGSVEETVSLVDEARPDFFRAQLWYCDPVTPIWAQREEHAIRGSAFNWTHATMSADEGNAIVDEMFRSIRGSIWLPQNGFEMWSLFYLQRAGMRVDQVKDYLKSWNRAVGETIDRGAPTAATVVDLSQKARAHLESSENDGIAPASEDELAMLWDEE